MANRTQDYSSDHEYAIVEKIGIKWQLFDESNRNSWSDLPCDLLEKIGKLLNNKPDVSRFRAVCHSWRLSVPPFKKQQLVFPMPFVDGAGKHATDILTISADSIVYELVSLVHDDLGNQLQLSKNWLMLAKEGKMVKALYPSLSLQSSKPKNLNLLDFGVFELARVYRLYSPQVNIVSNCKVAMSLTNVDRPELMILASDLFHHHCSSGVDEHPKVITNRGTKLTSDPVKNSDKLMDIIFHRGKFYAVARNGRAIVIDSSSTPLKPVTIAKPVSNGVYPGTMNLIESLGELLLVEATQPIKVFKLNTDEKRWVKMEHLNGQVLFVGDDCCFSVAAENFPGLIRDCIIYYNLEGEFYPTSLH